MKRESVDDALLVRSADLKPCRVCQEPTESPDELCSDYCRSEVFNEHPDYENERHPADLEEESETDEQEEQ